MVVLKIKEESQYKETLVGGFNVSKVRAVGAGEGTHVGGAIVRGW